MGAVQSTVDLEKGVVDAQPAAGCAPCLRDAAVAPVAGEQTAGIDAKELGNKLTVILDQIRTELRLAAEHRDRTDDELKRLREDVGGLQSKGVYEGDILSKIISSLARVSSISTENETAAVRLLEANQNKIDWKQLSSGADQPL